MSQDTGRFDNAKEDVDPGLGTAASMGLCFFADYAITFLVFLSNLGSVIRADGKLLIYVALFIPLAANGFAIWWAAATKRHRCMKGLIICTALVFLLDSACVGLSF